MRSGLPALLLVLAGCLAPAAPPPEALAPVTFAVESGEYDLGAVAIRTMGGIAYEAPLRGSLYRPAGDGPFPVVLVLHGNHGTCDGASPFAVTNDCEEAGGTPVPSHAGYAHLGEPLAAAGYLVLSLDANAVNERSSIEMDPHAVLAMFTRHDSPARPLWREARVLAEPTRGLSDQGIHARASLLLATLDALRDDAALAPLADLSRVGLVGHSRGAEAVVGALEWNAARDPADRHGIRAVVSLAPSAYEDWTPAGAALLFVLPYCDGDEWDLLGASLYDRSLYGDDPHPRFLAVLDGGNHAGYNSVWADRGADYGGRIDDPQCGPQAPSRLTAEEQLAHAAEFLVPFVRGRVGEESVARAVEAGAGLAVACERDCPFTFGLTEFPGAADRRVLLSGREPDAATRVRSEGFAVSVCAPPRCPGGWTTGEAPRLVLGWDGPARLAIPASDATGFTHLALRAALPDGAQGNAEGRAQDLVVALLDADGREAAVRLADHAPRTVAFPLGAPENRRVVLEGARLPLAAFAGVDLARLASVELRAATPAGTLLVADVLLSR